MSFPEDIRLAAPIRRQTSPAPRVGELVQVRSRRWLVDDVIEPKSLGQTCVVRLSCADDDAQGQSLEVLWDYELDRLILKEEGWAALAAKGFDPPRVRRLHSAQRRMGSGPFPAHSATPSSQQGKRRAQSSRGG